MKVYIRRGLEGSQAQELLSHGVGVCHSPDRWMHSPMQKLCKPTEIFMEVSSCMHDQLFPQFPAPLTSPEDGRWGWTFQASFFKKREGVRVVGWGWGTSTVRGRERISGRLGVESWACGAQFSQPGDHHLSEIKSLPLNQLSHPGPSESSKLLIIMACCFWWLAPILKLSRSLPRVASLEHKTFLSSRKLQGI